jgi:hypothetical protein
MIPEFSGGDLFDLGLAGLGYASLEDRLCST